MGIWVIIHLDHSSGYIWVCRILLNKVTKNDEEDGRLALIISLLRESWPLAFFDFKSVVPLMISSLVKGESKIVFLIFLSASLYRKRSWSSFLSFSEYNSFEKCSTHCCGEITFGVLDLIAFGFSVSSYSSWILFISLVAYLFWSCVYNSSWFSSIGPLYKGFWILLKELSNSGKWFFKTSAVLTIPSIFGFLFCFVFLNSIMVAEKCLWLQVREIWFLFFGNMLIWAWNFKECWTQVSLSLYIIFSWTLNFSYKLSKNKPFNKETLC